MKTRKRLSSVVTALLFFLLSAGLLIAQDQDGAPAPPPPGNYPVQQGGAVQYPAQQGDAGNYPVQQGDPGQAAQQQDPPGRVARVQYMSGQVSMQPGGVNDWIAASQNRPLTTADRIWTDKESRAELNVGDGFIRMNSETSVTLTNVSDQNVQLELDQGILNISVRHLAPGEIYEVDTPNYAFTVMKPGVYRFDVYPSEDQSWVTVRSGYGEATGRGSAVRVNSGQQVRFNSGNSLQHVAENAPARDGFDDWARVRDKRLEDSVSGRYVSPGVIGYQDLDAYGRWASAPQYGNVWVPSSVPPGWAPYRFGHWVWIAPWGWTWVDDQPWGFAPFHYGRWVAWGGGWAWAPGPVGYWNPYYAPALVGWVGGPGFGVGFGFGSGWGIGINVGWFPLGWGEPFFPRYCGWGHGGWYRGGGYVSNNYFRNVNVTNTHITNITNVTNNYHSGNVNSARYGFRDRPGAVTAAPGSAFTSGAAINRVGGAVPKADLGKGAMLRGVDVNPTHQSVLGGHTPETRGVPPASAFNRGVVTANRGPAMRPANLEAANQATQARGNLNANTRGGANSMPGATGSANAANNGHVNQPVNGRMTSPPSSTTSQVQTHGAPTAGYNTGHNETPTSMGGRYVPRPPSAGGNPTTSYHSGTPNGTTVQGQNGRPYEGNANPTHGAPTTNGARPYGTYNGSPVNGNERNGTSNPNAPRPTQTYPTQGRDTVAAPHQVPPSHPVQSAPQKSAPSSSGSKETPQHGESSRGPGAALSVPNPPGGPSYRSAPTYSASAGSAASRPVTGNYNAGRSTYTPAPGYSPGRSSTPSYTPSRTNTAPPAYRPAPAYQGSRGNSSSPAYASRSMGGYSAPRPSGGGAASYRVPSGGGGSRSGGGGGGSHSGGGHGR